MWLLIADAHARRNQLPQEFGVYDSLLRELAANAKNVPLGSASNEIPAAAEPDESGGHIPPRAPRPVRSPQYAEVLDRYLNRLVSLKRMNEAWRCIAARSIAIPMIRVCMNGSPSS